MDINLIPYTCGAGAKNDGCKDAPAHLRELGLDKHLGAKWLDDYFSPASGKYEVIKDSCNHLAKDVISTIKKNKFPITIGGDHSMAIGTFSGITTALNANGKFGLIWFDAHMDAHTPQTSESGAYHGMPVAHLLGYGDEGLRSIASPAPKISPEHLCLIGIRSYEDGEAKLLKKLGVRIFYIEEVNERGLKAVIKDALKIVKNGTKGYGITVDIDAFDPSEAPGTGSREPNGLHTMEAVKAFSLFRNDPALEAIEIAEYNHHLGRGGITSKLIFDLLGAIVK